MSRICQCPYVTCVYLVIASYVCVWIKAIKYLYISKLFQFRMTIVRNIYAYKTVFDDIWDVIHKITTWYSLIILGNRGLL